MDARLTRPDGTAARPRRWGLVALAAASLLAAPARAEKIVFLHTPATAAVPGRALVLSGSMFGASGLKKARCRYRAPGEGKYRNAELSAEAGDTWQATIPAAEVVPPALEYFCIGLDQDGDEVELFASASEPHSIPVKDPEPPPKPKPPEEVAPLAPLGDSSAAKPPPSAEAPDPASASAPASSPTQQIAVMGPALPRPLARCVETVASLFVVRGYGVVDSAQVAASHRAQKKKVPSCNDAPKCLADAARTVGAGLAASVSFHGVGKARTVKLVVVDAADGRVLASTSMAAPKATEVELVDLAGKLVSKVEPALGHGKPDKAAALSQGTTSTSTSAGTKASSGSGSGASSTSAGGGATPARPPSVSSGAAGALLGQARTAFDAMDYDTAAALATRALAEPGLDPEARLDAYLIQASGLAITADPVSAEVPFRLLLRARPDFQLPESARPRS
ncbi:MAG: hypothetical protein QM765_43175 [Myxococcales bacterium]